MLSLSGGGWKALLVFAILAVVVQAYEDVGVRGMGNWDEELDDDVFYKQRAQQRHAMGCKRDGRKGGKVMCYRCNKRGGGTGGPALDILEGHWEGEMRSCPAGYSPNKPKRC